MSAPADPPDPPEARRPAAGFSEGFETAMRLATPGPVIDTGEIVSGGVWVFKAAAVGVIVFTLISGALFLLAPLLEGVGFRNPSLGPVLLVRAADTLLRLAAVSVLVAMIAFTRSALLSFFGFLVIGGLIVPSTDILRFATMLYPGGEPAAATAPLQPETDRYLPQPTIKAESPGAGADGVAIENYSRFTHQMAYQLEKLYDGLVAADGGPAPQISPQRLRAAIQRQYDENRRYETAVELIGRGARDIYIQLHSDSMQELALLRDRDPRVSAELAYLRARGVVEYPFRHEEMAQLTGFGRSLAPYMDIVQLRRDGGAETGPIDLGPLSEAAVERLVTAGRDERVATFEVRPDAPAVAYVIDLRAIGPDVDPFLRVYGPDGQLIGEDDDGGGGFDSRFVLVRPAPGRYALRLRSVSVAGQMSLAVAAVDAAGLERLAAHGRLPGLGFEAFPPPAEGTGAGDLGPAMVSELRLAGPRPVWLRLDPAPRPGFALVAAAADGVAVELGAAHDSGVWLAAVAAAPGANHVCLHDVDLAGWLGLRALEGTEGTALAAVIEDEPADRGLDRYVCFHRALRQLRQPPAETLAPGASRELAFGPYRAVTAALRPAASGPHRIAAVAVAGSDPAMTVFDDAGAVVAFNDDRASDLSSEVDVDLDADRTYLVVITNLSDLGSVLLRFDD